MKQGWSYILKNDTNVNIYNVLVKWGIGHSGVARVFPGKRFTHPDCQNEDKWNEELKSLREKKYGNLRENEGKKNLLPTRHSGAGNAPGIGNKEGEASLDKIKAITCFFQDIRQKQVKKSLLTKHFLGAFRHS